MIEFCKLLWAVGKYLLCVNVINVVKSYEMIRDI